MTQAREQLLDVINRIKSELADRERFEAEMERRLGNTWNEQRKELMALLGDPPSISNVPESYWNDSNRAVRKILARVMEEIYIVQSFALAEQFNLATDWMMINQHAIDWASIHALEKAKLINDTSRTNIQELINRYYLEDWDLDELTRRISVWYNPARARTVAITETTNAAVQSQIEMANWLKQQYGIQFKETWRTSEYDRVCPLCAPLDGQPCSEVGYPPKHINCACYVEYELL